MGRKLDCEELREGDEEAVLQGHGVELVLAVPLRLPEMVGEWLPEREPVTVALRHKLLVPDLVGLLLLLLLPLTLILMEMVPDVVELALRLPVLHSVGLRDGVSVALEELL